MTPRRCAVPDCSTAIPRWKAMCAPHWEMVPGWNKIAINRAHAALDGPAWRSAVREAVSGIVAMLASRAEVAAEDAARRTG